MIIHTDDAIKKANHLVNKYGTRDADHLAREIGLHVMDSDFDKQMGVYKVILRNRFVFLKKDLHPVMRSIVLLHEIGHDMLHRKEAIDAGGFQEFQGFDLSNRRMEYEANIFAAEIMLPTDEILEYCYQGYNAAQIAGEMSSDVNLVSLKVAELKRKGHGFRGVEFDVGFLTGK